MDLMTEARRDLRALDPLCRSVLAHFYTPAGYSYDDLFQEARIGAWKALRDFRGDRGSGFPNFARICIERQVTTFVKTATRRKHAPLTDAARLDKPAGDDGDATLADVVLLSTAANPERRLIAREEFADVLVVLRELTLLERQAFLGFALDGLSYEQIAVCLDVDTKAVGNAIQRARRSLAHLWGPPTCTVCDAVLDAGNRCAACERDLAFARQFLTA
jgi:RNA polymerase sporulation-specific sigma factor